MLGRRSALAAVVVFSTVVLVSVGLTAPGPGERIATAAPFLKIGKAHPDEHYPVYDGTKPLFILVLGSDSRSKQWEAVAHGRSDVMELVGLNPAKGRASIIGFPRDSWVELAGHGKNKLNDAMYYGGPTGVVAEVEDLTGIHIDYYALTSFWNFRSLVHDIGGVDVDIPYPMKDSYSKANFKKGEQHLSGKQALAFARNRHDPPGGDFGRSFNCGTLLISFLRDFQEDFKQTPASVLSWLGAGLRNTRTDVPKDELLQLAFLASQIPVKNVNNFVVPGSTGMEGSESVVHLSSSAKSMYADLAKDGFIKEK